MRWATKYLHTIMASCTLMAFMDTTSAVLEDVSNLEELISFNENTHMMVIGRDYAT